MVEQQQQQHRRKRRWSTIQYYILVTLLAVNAVYLYLSTVFTIPSTNSSIMSVGTTQSFFSNIDNKHHRRSSKVSNADRRIDEEQRELEFLEFSWDYHQTDDPTRNTKPVEMNSNDAYSGAWWQSTSQFINYRVFDVEYGTPIEDIQEWASIQVFKQSQTNGDVTSTRDWLDLCVEHMSKWYKHIVNKLPVVNNDTEVGNNTRSIIEGRITDIFKAYVYSNNRRDYFRAALLSLTKKNAALLPQSSPPQLVTQSTLVVIPYTSDHTNIGIWSFVAMLVSLIQTGMGRIIISLHPTQFTTKNLELVRHVFAIVTNATSVWSNDVVDSISSNNNSNNNSNKMWTTFDICVSSDEAYNAWPEGTPPGQWESNVPIAMLRQLTRVLLNKTTPDVTKCWLGENNDNVWQYIYFSEPDLILHTRPESLHGIGRALLNGRLLAPHRIQPLPHALDFVDIVDNESIVNDTTRFIPNTPPFDNVIEIDTFQQHNHPPNNQRRVKDDNNNNPIYDSCCDRGLYKPYLLHKKCGNFWWLCGYNSKRSITKENIDLLQQEPAIPWAMVAHKRLLGYPMMRLVSGTGLVFASSESGKTCRPQIGPCSTKKATVK
jgi:hypothetical protein